MVTTIVALASGELDEETLENWIRRHITKGRPRPSLAVLLMFAPIDQVVRGQCLCSVFDMRPMLVVPPVGLEPTHEV